MKRSISLLLVAGMLSLVACGPGEKEKAAEAARLQDSITQDSTMRAMQAAEAALKATQDSLAMIAQDSVMKAMQDSITMLTKKPAPKPVKAKTPEEKKKEEVKKATQGRG
ncbi:MAG: hypothetical protein ABI723_15440 [Bacteroidia bacterium]